MVKASGHIHLVSRRLDDKLACTTLFRFKTYDTWYKVKRYMDITSGLEVGYTFYVHNGVGSWGVNIIDRVVPAMVDLGSIL